MILEKELIMLLSLRPNLYFDCYTMAKGVLKRLNFINEKCQEMVWH